MKSFFSFGKSDLVVGFIVVITGVVLMTAAITAGFCYLLWA